MHQFWTGFLLGCAVGVVVLVVYACCAIAARTEDE